MLVLTLILNMFSRRIGPGTLNFVGEVRRVMNENGYRVSVAVAPKVSDSQRGLLVEGMDYAALGENADAVFL